ncbi:unnamed protein product [Brassica oleracea]|uniref:(rape) hypothetical protein n=1 Tax=Brassica napus TaxID=3708 RepID=A0A816UQ57_BRANA|nr:unnamed protein product [Brassica napus]
MKAACLIRVTEMLRIKHVYPNVSVYRIKIVIMLILLPDLYVYSPTLVNMPFGLL